MLIEKPAAYKFLESLVDTKAKWYELVLWLIFHFVLLPRVFVEYLLYIKNNGPAIPRSPGNKWEWLIDSGLIVCLIVSNVWLKSWIGWAWPLIFTVINLISIALIALFAMPERVAADQIKEAVKCAKNAVVDSINKKSSELQRQIEEAKSNLLGHKLWSGENTYRLLEYLLTHDSTLGRAKWLLVNFLSDDIEKKIRSHKPSADDVASGNVNNGLIYEITVRDWIAPTYSQFLAKNMIYVRKSIHWVVDPVDLLTQIIPAHVIEVIISIGAIIDPGVERRIDEAQETLTGDPKAWGNFLGLYSQWCPRHRVRLGQCKGKHAQCEERFPFDKEPVHCQLDYLWYALFAGTLSKIKSQAKNSEIMLPNGKPVQWNDILEKYIKREDASGSLVLPHIAQFRKAPCSKKRHVYLGFMPGDRDDDTKMKTGTAYLKSFIDKPTDYIRSISPRLSAVPNESSIFSELLTYNWAEGKISLEIPEPSGDDLWNGLEAPIKALVLGWALDLFSYTSGGTIKGVFVDYNPLKQAPELPNTDYHDIEFYDGLLELSSARRTNRDVTWRVYETAIGREKSYFPDNKSDHLVSFESLRTIIMEALDYHA